MPGLLSGGLCSYRIGTPGGKLSGTMNMTVWRCWTRDGHRLIIPVCDD